MYILIDITNHQALARHESFIALAALAYIQFTNVDSIVLPLDANKHFTLFDGSAIRSISAHAGQIQPADTPYNELIKNMRAWLIAAPHLALPFSAELLTIQAHSIAPSEDRPFEFVPSDEAPRLARTWHYPPQQNRKRCDSSQAIHFASRAGPVPPLELTPKQPRTSAPAAPPKVKRDPSTAPPRERSSGAAARPKAGTSTGQVWDIADEVSATFTNDKTGKAVRKEVIERCEAAGINKSTAGVQFGKWAASQ